MPGRGGAALAALAASALLLLACKPRAPIDYAGPVGDWPEYGRTKGGLRFSPLTQITRANVTDLHVAWIYHHGDVSDGSDGTTRTSFNATPIVVDDALYFCTGPGEQNGPPTSRRRCACARTATPPAVSTTTVTPTTDSSRGSALRRGS